MEMKCLFCRLQSLSFMDMRDKEKEFALHLFLRARTMRFVRELLLTASCGNIGFIFEDVLDLLHYRCYITFSYYSNI